MIGNSLQRTSTTTDGTLPSSSLLSSSCSSISSSTTSIITTQTTQAPSIMTILLRLYKIFLWITQISRLTILLMKTLAGPLMAAIRPSRKKNVQNKVVLITGAGSGLGRELAIKFAAAGAITILWDINETTVKQTAEMIEEMIELNHQQTIKKIGWFVVDVRNEEQVAQAAQKLRQQFGDLDILVNNAGIAPCEPFKNLKSEKIREIFDVNIMAHFWTVKQFLPAMEKNNSGHIVAIASSAGIMGSPYFTAYGASKHAVVGFMKCMYEELDENSQIRLTTVCPLGISGTGIDIPTKTRFPWLLPVMPLEYAVELIFDAILREEEFFVLPKTFKWIHRLLSIFPQKMASTIWKCLDYSVVPTGLYAPIGRAHYHDRIYRKLSLANGHVYNNNHNHHGGVGHQQHQQNNHHSPATLPSTNPSTSSSSSSPSHRANRSSSFRY
uniref:Short-chain dehydrogenase/reductase 3 n=1 Tax=Dermatophagoides pteronyssinus TaxID=6956 RepID=A0A6P6Y458_DERPT|nr:epidermal retinol dehydrogenase 2-like [Dermatophagoides pteronyssinus]